MHDNLVRGFRPERSTLAPGKTHRPPTAACSKLEQVKCLILELELQRKQLSCDIEAEETASRIRDPQHNAYSPLARTLRDRRDRLDRSIGTLTRSLESF
jgi:hypothetical protein